MKGPLTKGASYRVTSNRASLDGMISTAPYAWQPTTHRLKAGDVIVYVGSFRGWGSDPVYEDRFRHGEVEGSFSPCFWGSANRDALEPVVAS